MKTIPKLLFFLLLPLFGFSQNWNLISSSRMLNFGTYVNDQVVDKTIFVQEAASIGADSIFRVGPRDLKQLPSYPYEGLAGNMLADSIVQKTNGLYEFHYTEFSIPGFSDLIDPPFFIQSLAEPGDTWIFQDTILAQVVSAEVQTVWGVADSVKTIVLSDGGVILLSKSFGLLQFRNYVLIGLQNTAMGVQLPTKMDWFDWFPGEVFQYVKVSGNNFDAIDTTWTKYTVLSKTIGPDTSTFTVHRLMKTLVAFDGQAPGPATYVDVVEPFFLANPTELDFPGYTQTGPCIYRTCEYTVSNSGITKLIGEHRGACSSGPYSSSIYIVGLGKTHDYFSLGGPYQSIRDLIGYLKFGQTPEGTIYPDSFYHVGVGIDSVGVGIDSASAAQGPVVFPNPTHDRANVQCAQCMPAFSIDLHDVMGLKVLSILSVKPQAELPIDGLTNGVYWLKIRSVDHDWTRKLVIQGN